MSQRHRLVFSGSGGQGVITASIILAEAAVLCENLNAVQTQVYGAAARGGATRSDVLISEQSINYPKVDQPNILVCLTQEAYNKYASIIRPGGLLLSDPRFITPQRKMDAKQIALPMYNCVMESIGKAIVFNICMLGAIVALSGVVQLSSIKSIIQNRIPPAFLSINQQALDMGYEMASSHIA